jgi:hypothetical protein
MSDYDKMKISEMRKMLKEHRKTHVHPVGKMSRVSIAQELDRYASAGSKLPEKSPVVKGQEEAVKKIVKEVKDKSVKTPKVKEMPQAPEKLLPLMEKKASKKVEDEAVEPAKQVARAKLIKGSKEARDFMAMIRMKKSKDKDVS